MAIYGFRAEQGNGVHVEDITSPEPAMSAAEWRRRCTPPARFQRAIEGEMLTCAVKPGCGADARLDWELLRHVQDELRRWREIVADGFAQRPPLSLFRLVIRCRNTHQEVWRAEPLVVPPYVANVCDPHGVQLPCGRCDLLSSIPAERPTKTSRLCQKCQKPFMGRISVRCLECETKYRRQGSGPKLGPEELLVVKKLALEGAFEGSGRRKRKGG